MAVKLYDSHVMRAAALLLVVVVAAAIWSWLPEFSRDWLAVIGVVVGFWVVWEACTESSGDHENEREDETGTRR